MSWTCCAPRCTPPRAAIAVRRPSPRSSTSASRPGGAEGKVVGTVTSAGMHADLGPIALAVVRRAAPLDEQLSIQVPVASADGEAGSAWLDAAQEPIVLPRDHGERPATPRL